MAWYGTVWYGTSIWRDSINQGYVIFLPHINCFVYACKPQVDAFVSPTCAYNTATAVHSWFDHTLQLGSAAPLCVRLNVQGRALTTIDRSSCRIHLPNYHMLHQVQHRSVRGTSE